MAADNNFNRAVRFGLHPAVIGSISKKGLFKMKKFLLGAGAVALSVPLAFAEGGQGPDWSAADQVVTAGQTALNTFITSNAGTIGTCVIAVLVIPMIFVVAKLFKRAGKSM